MAYPGDLNLIWIGIFDSRKVRPNHVGFIGWKLVGRNERKLARTQAQLPSQEVSKTPLRRVVKTPEPFPGVVGQWIGVG